MGFKSKSNKKKERKSMWSHAGTEGSTHLLNDFYFLFVWRQNSWKDLCHISAEHWTKLFSISFLQLNMTLRLIIAPFYLLCLNWICTPWKLVRRKIGWKFAVLNFSMTHSQVKLPPQCLLWIMQFFSVSGTSGCCQFQSLVELPSSTHHLSFL